MGYVPEAQGGRPPGPRVLHVPGTRTSLGRSVRTAHRVPPLAHVGWLSPQAAGQEERLLNLFAAQPMPPELCPMLRGGAAEGGGTGGGGAMPIGCGGGLGPWVGGGGIGGGAAAVGCTLSQEPSLEGPSEPP